MTSRQPENTPPGTTGLAAVPGGRGVRGGRGSAGSRHRQVPAPRGPVLVLPVALLIIAGLAGLRGGVTGPRWDGPLRGDALAVGVALELVLGITLGFTVRRLATRTRAGAVKAVRAGAAAVTPSSVLAFLLSTGMIAVAATLLVGLRRHLFSGPVAGQPGRAGGGTAASPAAQPGWHFPFHLHLHVPADLQYGLLVLLLLAAVVFRVWWVRRFGRSGPLRVYHYLAPDPQDLLEVVESGQWALRAIDEARAAIIACYVAMEDSLAEHGAARAIADTPDELLLRAADLGIVHGTAAARLTALFYEARFSSHPVDRGQRDAAGQALAELAAGLGART